MTPTVVMLLLSALTWSASPLLAYQPPKTPPLHELEQKDPSSFPPSLTVGMRGVIGQSRPTGDGRPVPLVGGLAAIGYSSKSDWQMVSGEIEVAYLSFGDSIGRASGVYTGLTGRLLFSDRPLVMHGPVLSAGIVTVGEYEESSDGGTWKNDEMTLSPKFRLGYSLAFTLSKSLIFHMDASWMMMSYFIDKVTNDTTNVEKVIDRSVTLHGPVASLGFAYIFNS